MSNNIKFSFKTGSKTIHAKRIGYVGKNGWSKWSGKYNLLDGAMGRSIYPKNNILNINVETESGSISIKILDKNKNIIFDEANINTGSYNVNASGKVTVKIDADKHKGSFSIE